MFERIGVRTLWMIGLALALLVPLKPAAVGAQGQGTYEGTLSIVWGDPRFPGTPAGGMRYFLATPDGSQVELSVTQNPNDLLRLQGHYVIVSGQTATAASMGIAARGSVVVASSIVDNPRFPAQAAYATNGAPDAVVSGTKKVIFVLLKYSDDTQTPHAPSFFGRLLGTDTTPDATIPTTINAFFSKLSNNTFSWTGDVWGAGGLNAPGGYLTLPKPKASYANCNFNFTCADLDLFTTDAVAVAQAAGAVFTSYDNINFVINNDLDCCAWGSSAYTIQGKNYGVTWEPPWGQITSTYSHEMGHSLGLPHSGWLYYSYDSPWDTMSSIRTASSVQCGSYTSRNSSLLNPNSGLFCDQPGDGYIAGHRDFLGWIPPANQVSVNSTTPTTTVTLEPNAIPPGANIKLIKICIPGFSCTGTGSTTRYFTVEARVKGLGTSSQFDNGIPNDGIIIHDLYFGRSAISGACYFNSQSGWAVPVDATPGDYNSSTCTQSSGGGLLNGQFTPGMTYTNATYGFKVIVNSKTGNNYSVTVQSTSAQPTQVTIDAPANGTTVAGGFTVQGWAVNRSASSGTGVDMVHVYATPQGGAASFLGQATYGSARGDIGALYGSQFTNSGYSFNAGALTAGNYTLTVYARNATSGTFDASASVSITAGVVTSTPLISVDAPVPNQVVTSAFEVGGWAIDRASSSGPGVNAVQFYVFPNAGASPGVFVGQGSYGITRNDVAAIFGPQFTSSGFHFTVTGLGPGSYVLGVYGRSTLTNTFSAVKMIPFSVSATALMSVDLPSPESTFGGNVFTVGGWSIDRNVEASGPTGTGVDTLHVWAYPNPGSGQTPIFLGVASVGVNRPDVGGLYGARYNNSGYQLLVNRTTAGLTPGRYSIAVHSHSSVTGTFNNLAVIQVTLQ